MAFVTEIKCKECGKIKREVTDHSGLCQDCRAKISSKKRRIYLAGLRGMTIEERIERIESQLYDLNLSSRLDALEVSNIRYA